MEAPAVLADSGLPPVSTPSQHTAGSLAASQLASDGTATAAAAAGAAAAAAAIAAGVHEEQHGSASARQAPAQVQQPGCYLACTQGCAWLAACRACCQCARLGCRVHAGALNWPADLLTHSLPCPAPLLFLQPALPWYRPSALPHQQPPAVDPAAPPLRTTLGTPLWRLRLCVSRQLGCPPAFQLRQPSRQRRRAAVGDAAVGGAVEGPGTGAAHRRRQLRQGLSGPLEGDGGGGEDTHLGRCAPAACAYLPLPRHAWPLPAGSCRAPPSPVTACPDVAAPGTWSVCSCVCRLAVSQQPGAAAEHDDQAARGAGSHGERPAAHIASCSAGGGDGDDGNVAGKHGWETEGHLLPYFQAV